MRSINKNWLAILAVVVLWLVTLAYIWDKSAGLTLTSGDDALRLLMAHQFSRYGDLPVHWTWPPLPMLLDGIIAPYGGDTLIHGILVRVLLIACAGIFLVLFWNYVFGGQGKLAFGDVSALALWLFFPINVRLALSGLSEPYMYAFVALGLYCWARGSKGDREECVRPDGKHTTSTIEVPWWLLGASLAFGLAIWCRYEPVLIAVMFGIWLLLRLIKGGSAVTESSIVNNIGDIKLRSKWIVWRYETEALALLVLVAFPLGYLVYQYLVFNDPLNFVSVAQQEQRIEARLFFATDALPVLTLMLQVLRSWLWSPPILSFAFIGFARLLFVNRLSFFALIGFFVLFGIMAAIGMGIRMEFYLNTLSLLLLPLAVQGSEYVIAKFAYVATILGKNWSRTRIASASLAVAVLTQVTLVDLPKLNAFGFGSWLLPEHRQLFVDLRTQRVEVEKTLVLLDASKMGRADHPWDYLALALADPDSVTVFPSYANVNIGPCGKHQLSWQLDRQAQEALVADPTYLTNVLKVGGFVRLKIAYPVSSELQFRLRAAGYTEVQCNFNDLKLIACWRLSRGGGAG
jgi:hypothetical protein